MKARKKLYVSEILKIGEEIIENITIDNLVDWLYYDSNYAIVIFSDGRIGIHKIDSSFETKYVLAWTLCCDVVSARYTDNESVKRAKKHVKKHHANKHMLAQLKFGLKHDLESRCLLDKIDRPEFHDI